MKKKFFSVLVLLLVWTMMFSLAACDLFGKNDGKNNSEGNEGLSEELAGLPDQDAVNALWTRLEGYWNTTDSLFIGFIYEDGAHTFVYGLWESDFFGVGKLTDSRAMGEYEAVLTILFPEVDPDELSDGRPEMKVEIVLDLSGLEQDGKPIRVKIGDDAWHQYTYGGKTSEEAYQTFFEHK